MNNSFIIRNITLLVVCVVSAITDLSSGRIKNVCLLAGLVPVLIAHLTYHTFFLTGDFICQVILLFLLFLFFKMRLLGGGDVKLYGFLALSRPDDIGLYIAAISFFLALIFESARLVLLKHIEPFGLKEMKVAGKSGIPMAFYVFLAVVMVFFREGAFIWTE